MRSSNVLIALLFAASVNAQPFNWQWATAIPGSAFLDGMVTDAEGNTYVSGSFVLSITFGTLPTLVSAGSNDGFIAKYSADGEVLWVLQVGGTGLDECRSIGLDALGGLYVTGSFASPTFNFGALQLSLEGTSDAFVAKLDTAGQTVWLKDLSDDANETEGGLSIVADAVGNTYTTGYFQDALIVPGLPPINSCVSNSSMFLVKLDSNGNGVWISNPACPRDAAYGTAIGDMVHLDPQGDLIVAGRYRGDTCDVGADVFVNPQGGYNNVLLAKYDTDGTQQWARGFGSSGDDRVYALDTDADGNCYVGLYRANGDILLPEFEVTYLGSIGPYHVVILKADPSGTFLWAERIGNYGADQRVTALHVLDDNSFVVGGEFTQSCVFDGFYFPFGNSQNALYLARYDPSATAQEVFVSHHVGSRKVSGIRTDEAGNLFVGGNFTDTITFGDLPTLDVPSPGLFLSRSGDLSTGTPPEEVAHHEVLAYPNLTAGMLRLTSPVLFDRFQVINAAGQVLLERGFTPRTAHEEHLEQSGPLVYMLWHNGELVGQGRIVLVSDR